MSTSRGATTVAVMRRSAAIRDSLPSSLGGVAHDARRSAAVLADASKLLEPRTAEVALTPRRRGSVVMSVVW